MQISIESLPQTEDQLKEFFISNGMEETQWNEICSAIETSGKIHESILFFMVNPFDILHMIPQKWWNMFPDGFIDTIEKLGKNMDATAKRDLFRRAAYFRIKGPSFIMLRDVNIDDFLESISEEMYDIVMSKPEEIDSLISYCKSHGQEDTSGYSKLLLLK